MLASIGSNFASDLWGQFATDTLIPKQQQADQTLQQANTGTATGGIGLGIPSPIGGLEIARQVLRSELCLATYQANPVLKSGILTRLNPYGGTPIPTAPAVAGMKNADGDKQVWDYQQCGSIDVPLIVQLATTNSASLTNGTSSASQTYVSAKITAVGAIIQGVRNSGLAQKMALSRQPGSPAGSVWPTGVVSSLVSVGSAYDSAMMTSAGAFIYSENTSSYTKIANDAKTIGWVSMGAYSRTLSQASSTVTELASQPPMFNGPLTPGTFTSSDPDLVINKMTANLKLLDDQWTAESAVPSLSGAELAGPGDANSDLIGRLINPISKPMTQALLGLGTTGATDPMRSIMNFGHVMMGIGEGAIATGAGVGFAFGNAISEKFGGPVVFQWVSAFVIPLICFVIFVGFTHAVIFPMMPYVSVLYLFCDWVLFVAEALIAVSLYFFFWFRMDGTELFGEHQKAGAIIMFNILLMPTLGVLGFEMVYYVLPIMIGFVNMTFGPAYVGIQGGHFVGLFIAFGGLAFQTYLLGQVTVRACSLIHEIVTRVPRWFGASADPHGASNDVSRTHNVVVGSVGSFNKTVGGAVQQNLGKTPPKTPGGNGGNDKPTPKV
jgi:conjugal transfer/type IV secretion protein DotA/TraY